MGFRDQACWRLQCVREGFANSGPFLFYDSGSLCQNANVEEILAALLDPFFAQACNQTKVNHSSQWEAAFTNHFCQGIST